MPRTEFANEILTAASKQWEGRDPINAGRDRTVLGWFVVLVVLLGNGSSFALDLPPGFEQSVFVAGLHDPNAMEFAPDGRLFIAERINGRLRVVQDGELLPEPFVTVSVPLEVPGNRAEAARPGFQYQGIYHYGTYRSSGLKGIAFDPEFEDNGHIYLYYMNDSPRLNRVSRFTASRDDPNRAEPDSEVALLDIPMHTQGSDEPVRDGGSHNGGALVFGTDGKLYITVGDGWNPAPPDAPQDPSNLIGKILRLNPDGTIPEDNPFVDTPGTRAEIWALGFRNPYTVALHPETGEIHVNDVAGAGKQTVFKLVKGGNYQHPSYQGFGARQSPWHAGVGLIAGGTWYLGALFPTEYQGNYFLSDWRGHAIRRIRPEQDTRALEFAPNAHHATVLKQGPDEALYWLSTNYETLDGIVYRIGYQADHVDDPPTESILPLPPIPTDELAGSWPLDDGEGDLARDLSGHGRHGRLVGNLSWATGQGDERGLVFDGQRGHLELKPFDLDANGLTLAAWIRPESFLGGMADNRILARASGVNEQDHDWMLSTIRSGGVIRLRFRLKTDGQTSTLISTRGLVARETWTHVAATFDGKAMRLFQDGQEVGSMPKQGVPDANPSALCWVGDNPPEAGSRPFHGTIRAVGVYQRSLSTDELRSLLAETDPRQEPRSNRRRSPVLDAYRPARELVGDAGSGQAIFQERCINCHRLDGEGVELGPDLAGLSDRDRPSMLEAILDPSREVAPAYWNYVIETRQGTILQGVIVREEDDFVVLRPLLGDDQTVPRTEIEFFQRLDTSIMPDGLEEGLTPQDLADVLAYVLQFHAPRTDQGTLDQP